MAEVTLIAETKKGRKPSPGEIAKIIAEHGGDAEELADYIDGLYDMDPEQLASNAGRACYESEMPAIDKEKIKVKERLFDTGHHTTLEHSYFTFSIDDISVSTITFGLHLAHPFYNSDQRSGRYSKMYDEPDLGEISRRVETYSLQECPKDSFASMNVDQVMDFIGYGLNVFGENKEKLTDIAADVLRRERPNVSDKYVEQNAKKMAQEQLRVFVSTVAPTGMYHTVDLATLAALFRVAWTPEMRQTANLMKDSVLEKHPVIGYMFDEGKTSRQSYNFIAHDAAEKQVCFFPMLRIEDIDIPPDYVPGLQVAKDSVDLSAFEPHCMDNNVYSIRTSVELSTMTMGQDQRHRTISRGKPSITGDFYLPPLLKIAGLEDKAEKFRKKWVDLRTFGPGVMQFTIPYGARVRYQKRGSINALLHEISKRSCWCTQEEIYNLSIQLVRQLNERGLHDLIERMVPPCKYDHCIEGARSCGRDLGVWKGFAERLAGFQQRQI
ncbi:MAG: FAD-dependent thymidylate synthase [Rickettsiales bacterium]|jgi:thymidylate synthase ThyX|nr:FAD-dependent thymidylate synthase [Rickettsiales bacterium]